MQEGEVVEIMVRVRIAPSPTGFPHIGTIYQALFNFAFAKKNNGEFIVRIEDTDKKRLVERAEKKIFEALDWFGLSENESPRKDGQYTPYRQSERLEIYKKYAKELVKKGFAYYCFCSQARLEELRKRLQGEKKIVMYDKHCRNLSSEEVLEKLKKGDLWVIRLKVPENQKITVKDEIRGEIIFDSNTVDDQVLLKSNGYPTYHLAATVDDYLMKITHVVRGEEWLSSAPKHFLLYDYLGFEKPLFYHTPDLRNPDHSKLSKRHGHTDVFWYKEQGFLPEAILNFLALLGWSHPEEKEIFSLDEFVKFFDLKDIKAVGPVFDLNKLIWMNGNYIRQTQNLKLKTQIYEFYNKKYSEELIEKTMPLVKERIKTLADYLPLCQFFFEKPKEYEIDLSGKKSLFEKVYNKLEKVSEWKSLIIGEVLGKVAKDLNIKNSEFFMLLRISVTGKKISPPLNESMEILGKEETVSRIKKLTL